MTKPNDVLEHNVSSLLESGGEPPRIADAARARIRDELIARHTAPPQRRLARRLAFAGLGLAAAAAVLALVFVRGGKPAPIAAPGALADGTTFVAEPGARVTVLGPRHVRVEGEALLDVVPGKGPFVVETARGRIEVLGTRFVVDGELDRTLAAVVRGEVKLATDLGDVVLHAGEQGVAEPGRAPTRGPAPRLSHLVSWAREARQPDQPVHHGTLFARDPGVRSHPPWGHEYPLPIKQLTLDVQIEDQVARVAIDQTFHNDRNEELEGVYRFAIPPDAALQRLAMYVDGKLEESAVVERMKARRIYENLVYRRIDPALLEWAGTGRLSLRVYPIHAGQDKRLMLAYTQSLPRLYDDWTLTVPLPEVDRAVGDLEIALRVKGCAGCELTSPSYPIKVTRDGDDAIVHAHEIATKLGDSFVLHVRDPRAAVTLATQTDAGDRYVMVRAPAGAIALERKAAAYRPRTWVILDDTSASREPLELRAQQDLIDSFLKELDENDRVAVIAFDVTARQKLAPTRVLDVDRAAVRKALADEGGVGATDFEVALDAATQALAGVAPDDARIVYLGDGVITAGPRELDKLRAKIVGRARFIGVGVGDGPDTQTLDALAAATGGYATTIDLADDLGWRAFDLVAALHTARVTDVSAHLVDAAGQLVPATAYLASPQLADGEELELVAKLAGDGTPAALVVDGTLDGAPWHRRIALDTPPHADAGYLPRMWAQRHIAARLLAKHEPPPPCTGARCPSEADAREARDEAIRQEVVALGKRYFLLSRHTSLLVLENDAMYAQYGVTKGSGDTWAPYALPATIPVEPPTTASAPPSRIADDAVLVRRPLQVFYDVPMNARWQRDDDLVATLSSNTETEHRMFTIDGRTGGKAGEYEPSQRDPLEPLEKYKTADLEELGGDTAQAQVVAGQDEAQPQIVTRGFGAGTGRGGGGAVAFSRREALWYGGQAYLSRLLQPADPAFDDLTAFVPALASDDADAWRDAFAPAGAQPAPHAVDAAARAQLERARAALAPGVYRWDDRDVAVDAAHRFGWRQSSPFGLAETASYDGSHLVRRYAELGLDVTRAADRDDPALQLAYLPLWIAPVDHYARWFDVVARGPHEVELRHARAVGAPLVLVLTFDERDRLIAIRDGAGAHLVDVTWGATGPSAAHVRGEPIDVGFTGDPVADAPAWAHGGSTAGVEVELPAHLVAYEQRELAKAIVGSPQWRQIQRQLLVSEAATGDRVGSWTTLSQLQGAGGLELGDVVLASGGLATAGDRERTAALAAIATTPIGRYLAAAQVYASGAAHVAPVTRDGLIGALWSLREVTAMLQRGRAGDVSSDIAAISERAPEARYIAASAASQWGALDPDQLAAVWDAAAIGPFRNQARAQAALVLASRGNYDAAADRIVALVSSLDLRAIPPQLVNAQSTFASSRRGTAGWDLAWAQLRERVLAGDSFAHVMALVPIAAQRSTDLPAVLARGAALAGDDADEVIELARAAAAYGQVAWAARAIDPLVKRAPSRELYQLAAGLALQLANPDAALVDLEAAQDLAAAEPADLAVVRGELTQLIAVAQQVAVQASGAARQHAIERAQHWAAHWRAIDPGNPEIDRQLGELLLAVGDRAGAWRELSTTIERDPWSGDGYMTVADAFERQGRVEDALSFWQQAIVIDQTNPTPRLRKAQALIALGRRAEGDVLLHDITSAKWHDVWSQVVYQAQTLLEQEHHR